MSESRRFAFIDGLRGIAALAVVIFHLVSYGALKRPDAHGIPWLFKEIVSRGGLGVEMFFAISGFVIAYTTRDAKVTPGFLGRFVLRRSIRLDPPYWTTIALVTAINLLAMVFLAQPSKGLPGPGTLLAHVLYLQGLLGITHLSVGLWTLCIEFQFYLTLVILTGLVQRLPFRRWISVLVIMGPLAVLSLVTYLPSHGTGVLAFDALRSLLPNFWLFFVGATAWWTIDQKVPVWFFALVVLGGLARLVLAFEQEILVSGLTALALYAAARTNHMNDLLAGPVWQFFGKISYSLYLIHFPIGWLTFKVGYKVLGNTFATSLLLIVPSIATAVAVAWLMHRFVETPSGRLSHRVNLGEGPIFRPRRAD